jgi:hypothetical protein
MNEGRLSISFFCFRFLNLDKIKGENHSFLEVENKSFKKLKLSRQI